jgi:hypothetical protein
MYVCICVCMYACMCFLKYVCVCMHVCVYVCMRVYVFMCVCLYKHDNYLSIYIKCRELFNQIKNYLLKEIISPWILWFNSNVGMKLLLLPCLSFITVSLIFPGKLLTMKCSAN